MKHLTFLLLVIAVVAVTANAQLTITGTTPANNATNVAASTTISITFSAAIDTSILQQTDRGVFSNIDTISVIGLSPDKRTITYAAHLTPGRAHYAVYYFVKAASGENLTTPYVFYFTTAASFPPASVSGSIQAGSSGVDPAGCLVVLSDGPVSGGGKPNLMIGTVSGAAGAFTIPYVSNGTYYPIAVKDLDHDGEINPETSGDPFVQGNAITVSGTSITGVNLQLAKLLPVAFRVACDSAAVAAATLPVDRSLRMVECNDPDSLGLSGGWNFNYVIASRPAGARIRISPMGAEFDSLDSGMRMMLAPCRQLTNLTGAADASTFLTNCENAGGHAFRTQPMGDTIEFHRNISLGDLRWNEFMGMITDTSKNYWGASYWWGHTSESMWIQRKVMRFLGDFQTGTVLRTTDVRPTNDALVPEQISLGQNYPNPFNPSTTLSFSIPGTQDVSLRVYNILGEEMVTLAEGVFARGAYSVQFTANDLPSGMYLTVLRSGGSVRVQKMLLMR